MLTKWGQDGSKQALGVTAGLALATDSVQDKKPAKVLKELYDAHDQSFYKTVSSSDRFPVANKRDTFPPFRLTCKSLVVEQPSLKPPLRDATLIKSRAGEMPQKL